MAILRIFREIVCPFLSYTVLALPSPALPGQCCGRRGCPVYSHPRCLQPLQCKCSKVFSNQQTHIAKWVLRRFATSCDVLATYLRRRKFVAGRRIGLSHRKKMKYKSAFKPFINTYNPQMCTLSVYGSTGNKQTNKQTNTRTLAFYKVIDITGVNAHPRVNAPTHPTLEKFCWTGCGVQAHPLQSIFAVCARVRCRDMEIVIQLEEEGEDGSCWFWQLQQRRWLDWVNWKRNSILPRYI